MESIKSMLSTLYSYCPFPIYPTSHPYLDFIISFSLTTWVFLMEKDCFENMENIEFNENYYKNLYQPRYDYDDLNLGGQIEYWMAECLFKPLLIDLTTKTIRLGPVIVNDISNVFSRIYGDNLLQEDKSIHGFLNNIQNRLDKIEEEENVSKLYMIYEENILLKQIDKETIDKETIDKETIDSEEKQHVITTFRENRQERIELIKEQIRIKKEMKYYCFGNDPDLD